ncbi:MAG: PilN domain-containing protein [Patescibacteria group bacterium]
MPQDQNNTKKDINLLPEDLQKSIKPSVSLDIAPKKKERELEPMRKEEPMQRSTGSGGVFSKLFAKKQSAPEPEEKEEEKNIEFSKGAKPSFTVAVKDASDEKEEAEPPAAPPPPPPPAPDPAKKPPTEKPSAPISLKVEEPKPKPDPPPPEKKIEEKVADDKNITVTSKDDSDDQPDRSKLSLSSIKDFLEKEVEETSGDEVGVNLIPKELQSAEESKDVLKLVILFGLFSVAIVGAALVALTIFGATNKQYITNLQEEVAQYEQEIQASQSDITKLAEFTEQTQKVSEILNGREKWSLVFDFLEDETLPEVYYDSMSIGTNDTVTLDVYARSYFDLARQYRIFQEHESVSGLEMNAASLDTERWDLYINEVKSLIETAEIEGAASSSLYELLDPEISERYLTVNSTINFVFKIQEEESILDKYE